MDIEGTIYGNEVASSQDLSVVMSRDYDCSNATIDEINAELNRASKQGDCEAIRSLFDRASGIGEEFMRKLEEAKSRIDGDGLIPGLRFEKETFTLDTLKLLLDGVDLKDNRYNTKSGSVLHYAIKRGNKNLIEYLIATEYPLYKENSEGLTPLNKICVSGPDWAGIMLLEAPIEVSLLNTNELSSLHYAVKYNRIAMFRELIKYGAEDVGKARIFETAVEAGNYEIVKFCCNEPKFHPSQGYIDLSIELAVKNGYVLIRECLIKNGADLKKDSLLKVAIANKQIPSLVLLLQNGAKITTSDMEGIYTNICDEVACITLPTLLKHWGILDSYEIREFIETLIIGDYPRCAYIFTKNILDNQMCDISKQVLSQSNSCESLNLFELAAKESEEVFIVLLDYMDIDAIKDMPKVYHILLRRERYRALKKILDRSVKYKWDLCEIHVKFLSSIEYSGLKPNKNVYPTDFKFTHYAPSLLHKLIRCQDSRIRFHPLVIATAEKKLSVYRWWYVLTFALYCIFLAALYYALFQASFQCDAMLFSYTGSSGAFRAVCELVVVIYALIFSIDECMEFVVRLIRFSVEHHQKKNLYKVLCEKKDGTYPNMYHFRDHLPFLLMKYFGAYNIIDLLGLTFLFFLITFRLASYPFQWTFASLTSIFFTLRLFKYTRFFPPLGAYVRSIFQIFLKDITQFAAIVLIIMLSYFGGIHLAARQTFRSRVSSTLLFTEGCSNDSLTGLFWFDQERTSMYDLRRPLLSVFIFLLDGGPGNVVTELLDSNFLFVVLYLSSAFTLIVVMSNILIAQMSQRYAKITQNSDLPFKLDLAISVEYESNLAAIFGKLLRKETHHDILTYPLREWKKIHLIDPHSDILTNIEESSNVLTTKIDKNMKETAEAIEFQKKSFKDLDHVGQDVKHDVFNVKLDIGNVKLAIGGIKKDVGDVKEFVRQDIGNVKENIDGVKRDLETRMGKMEGMMEEMLSLLQQPTPTAATK